MFIYRIDTWKMAIGIDGAIFSELFRLYSDVIEAKEKDGLWAILGDCIRDSIRFHRLVA